MWYEDMFVKVESLSDKMQSEKMSAYMQNKFPFLGVPKPTLQEVIKQYLKDASKSQSIDWDFIKLCWNKDYREAQYIAIEYLKRNKKKLAEDDLEKLKNLAVTKSWWETADSIDEFVGLIVLKSSKAKNEMLNWSKADNIWLRRIAIDYQQKYKEITDAKQLESIICNNFGTDEFYINKAIGWSLREYSKINPQWVRDFIEKHKDEMSKLSIREASKYL